MWHADQNDNKTRMKTITFGVKNGPCETLPTFDDLHLVLRIPYMLFCVYPMKIATLQVLDLKKRCKACGCKRHPTKKQQYELLNEGVKPALGKTI